MTVEPLDALFNGIQGRQDQHRLGEAIRPEVAEHIQPMTAEEHEVEDHRINGLGHCGLEAFVPRGRRDDLVALRHKPRWRLSRCFL